MFFFFVSPPPGMDGAKFLEGDDAATVIPSPLSRCPGENSLFLPLDFSPH